MDSLSYVGLTGRSEMTVTYTVTASAMTDDGVSVLATPYLVAVMELAACNALHPVLPVGMTSVGGGFEFRHTAPTIPGMTVRAEAEVTGVKGRAVCFNVRAFDNAGEIGSGTHTRFIVDKKEFIDKAQRRADGG